MMRIVTRHQIRQGLAETPIADFEVLVGQRQEEWISDEAVVILDRLGNACGFGPFWWREPEGPDKRGMSRQLREVLDDVDRTGRGMRP